MDQIITRIIGGLFVGIIMVFLCCMAFNMIVYQPLANHGTVAVQDISVSSVKWCGTLFSLSKRWIVYVVSILTILQHSKLNTHIRTIKSIFMVNILSSEPSRSQCLLDQSYDIFPRYCLTKLRNATRLSLHPLVRPCNGSIGNFPYDEVYFDCGTEEIGRSSFTQHIYE